MLQSARRTVWLVVCLCAVMAGGHLTYADDPAPKLTAEQANGLWERSATRVDEIGARIQEIRQSPATTPEEQKKSQAEFADLVAEIKSEFSRIGGLVPQVYPARAAAFKAGAPKDGTEDKREDKDRQLAYTSMQLDYTTNRFLAALKIAHTLSQVHPDDPYAPNVAGACRFALHDFVGSKKILDQQAEAGTLIPQISQSAADSAEAYIGYWEKEKAIRAEEAAAQGDAQLPQVSFVTTRGEIILELFENEAPNTVANFVSLVEKEYYNGLKFHRVIPNFMAQGGCPNSREGSGQEPGSGGPGYQIQCECYAPNARRHFAGTLSMAHAGKNTGGSQFFITHLPTPFLDREIRPESVHTVFGRVVKGMDVVAAIEPNDTIKTAKVLRKRNHEYKPEVAP